MPLEIARRYCGPPNSANGGYFAGLLAQVLSEGANAAEQPWVEVTLRKPAPLGRALSLSQHEDVVGVHDHANVVADARLITADLDLDVPDPIGLEQAETAADSFIYRSHGHPFPTCFVCGTQRKPGDGLRLFPGPIADQAAACTWTVQDCLGDATGIVRPEFIWAALDCPSYFGAIATGHAEATATLLGRMTAQIQHRPAVGESLVVVGWGESRQDRRSQAGSAVYRPNGQLCALARSIWFRLA